MAVAAARPDRLEGFYCDLLGLRVVRRAANQLAGPAVLFSGRPAEEDHELVLLTNPQAAHVAFRVASRTELSRFYRRALGAGVPMPILPQDLGLAHSVFVTDPEGNHIEVYWATGRPPADAPRPLDLDAGPAPAPGQLRLGEPGQAQIPRSTSRRARLDEHERRSDPGAGRAGPSPARPLPPANTADGTPVRAALGPATERA